MILRTAAGPMMGLMEDARAGCDLSEARRIRKRPSAHPRALPGPAAEVLHGVQGLGLRV